MGLRRKYWIFSITCITAFPAALFVLAFFFFRRMPPQARELLKNNLVSNLPVLLTVCLLLLMGLLILLNEIFHGFILPLLRLKEDLRLVTAARSGHRINFKGSRELGEFAENINRAAELIQALQKGYPETSQPDKEKRIRGERDFLGGLLNDMPAGVIAGNANGRIFLYTQAAAELVERLQGPFPSGPPAGLDRSIFAVFSDQLGSFGPAGADTSSGGSRDLPTRFESNGVRGHILKIESEEKRVAYYLAFLQDVKQTPAGSATSAVSRQKSGDGRKKGRSDKPNYDFSLLKQARNRKADILDVRLSELTYTVFDLETTGMNPGGDEILSIGAVRVVNGRILFEETFYQMVNPQGEIPADSTRVHGITSAMLKGQPGIEKVLPAFRRYIEDSVLVAHDAEFDLRFLKKYAHPMGLKIDNPVLDTFQLSVLAQRTQRDHTLENIARRLGTRVYDRHIAYGDAWTAAEILLKLISVLDARGISSLRQVQQSR